MKRTRDETAAVVREREIECTPEEWEEMNRRAAQHGMSISEFVIACCRRAREQLEEGSTEGSQASEEAPPVVVEWSGGKRVSMSQDEAIRFLLLSEDRGPH